MNDLAGVLADAQTQTRVAHGFLPTGDPFDYFISPFEHEPGPAATVPELGQQTADVLAGLDRVRH